MSDSDVSEAEEVGFEFERDEDLPSAPSDDDEGEELFGNDLIEKDYAPNPELDHYDPTLLDESEQTELSVEERRKVDAILNKRDGAQQEQFDRLITGPQKYYQHVSLLLEQEMDDEDDEGDDDESEREITRRRRRLREVLTRSSKPDLNEVNFAREELPECRKSDAIRISSEVDEDASLGSSWNSHIDETIKIIFFGFFWYFTNEEENQGSSSGMYMQRIYDVVHESTDYVTIDWKDLMKYSRHLCSWITYMPDKTLKVGTEVLKSIISSLFNEELYKGTLMNVRISGHPFVTAIRHLTVRHLHQFITTTGICTRRSEVIPTMHTLWLECLKCNYSSNGPYILYGNQSTNLSKFGTVCLNCQKNGPFKSNRDVCIFENFQIISIQEISNTAEAGHIPRSKSVILCGSLVNTVRPGDRVTVSGVYESRWDVGTNAKTGFPVLQTQLVANHVERHNELKFTNFTTRDIEIIKRLARNPRIRDKLIDSIAPSIWGHRHIKTGLANVMFGGVRTEANQNHVIRGDINMLIVGDPGMAKSQFLKFVNQTAERSVLTTGKGASAVGLTAAVRRDFSTREWCLEGGAFVLADEGVCIIDEFDKMSDKDRVSIHEAMEQQSISISKAGIVASLKARCGVIAAANPIFGRYDSSLSLNENVDLSAPILSRFDIVAIVQDKPMPLQDLHLAKHVLESHIDAHPDSATLGGATPNASSVDETPDESGYPKYIRGTGAIPHRVLRQYLAYARTYCKPELRKADENILVSFYTKLREATGRSGGIPMTVRHFESILRIATSNAKMRLSRYVEQCDIDFAIATMLESFIQSQKVAVAGDYSRKFSRFRVIATSYTEYLDALIMGLFNRHLSGIDVSDPEALASVEIPVDDFIALAKSLHGIPDTVVKQFMNMPQFKTRFTAQRSQTGMKNVITKNVEGHQIGVVN